MKSVVGVLWVVKELLQIAEGPNWVLACLGAIFLLGLVFALAIAGKVIGPGFDD